MSDKKKNKNGKTSWLILVVLLATFVASFLFKYYQIKDFKGLLAFDPNYFMARTNYILDGHDPRQSAYDLNPKIDSYPFFLSLFAANLHRLTNIEVLTLYKVLGPFLTSFLIFLMYIFLRRYFDPLPSVLGATFFALAPVIMYRGQLTVAENLGLVFFLAMLYCFSQNKSAENLALGLFFWAAWFAAHMSALYFLPIMLAWLFISRAIFRYFKVIVPLLVLGFVAVAVFWKLFFSANLFVAAGDYIKIFFTSNLAFAWPQKETLDLYLRFFLLPAAIVGIPISIYWAGKKRDGYSLIFAMAVVFLIVFFIFRGTSENAGEITPDRLYPFVALVLAILATFTSQLIYELNKGVFFAYAIAFFVLSILPVKDKGLSWFEAYTPPEIEAAEWLKLNTAANSIVFTQPIMNRLVASFGKRPVWFGEECAPTQVLIRSPEKIKAKADKYDSREAYIYIAKQKNEKQFLVKTTYGEDRRAGWGKPFQLYGLDLESFQNSPSLQKMYENNAAVIYYVL